MSGLWNAPEVARREALAPTPPTPPRRARRPQHGAGYDDLPRAVEVRRHQHVALRAFVAERLHAGLVGLQERAHRARMRGRSLGHEPGALLHEREGGLARQHAGGGQGARLPQREPQHGRRLHAARRKRPRQGHRQRAQRRLGVPRVVEPFRGGVRHEAGHVEAEHVGCARERLGDLLHVEKVGSHPRLLRPLPREQEDGCSGHQGGQLRRRAGFGSRIHVVHRLVTAPVRGGRCRRPSRPCRARPAPRPRPPARL